MEREEYLNIRKNSLIAPKPKIEISDEDLLRKIAEYVEQAFYIFKKYYHEPANINKSMSKIIGKKKNIVQNDLNEQFVKKLVDFSDKYEATELYKFIIDLLGYNGLPKIVSDEEFSKLPKNMPLLYRGVKERIHTAELLAKKYNYHYGYGGYANGIYASPSKELAQGYARYKDDNVLKLLVTGKGADFDTIDDIILISHNKSKNKFVKYLKDENEIIQRRALLFFDTYQELPKNIKDYVYKALKEDLSLLGLFLGYDYMVKYEQYDFFTVCILNRASMVVPQSEYNRFVKGTKYENNNDNKSSDLEESQPQ